MPKLYKVPSGLDHAGYGLYHSSNVRPSVELDEQMKRTKGFIGNIVLERVTDGPAVVYIPHDFLMGISVKENGYFGNLDVRHYDASEMHKSVNLDNPNSH